MCPVHALDHIVYNILAARGDKSTMLCSIANDGYWIPVESHHIISDVHDKSKKLKLNLQCIDPDLFEAHYLRAWGDIALKLYGYDDTTIMKMGFWESLAFVKYIHNQIAHLSKDISQKMSMALPFFNVSII